MLLPLGADPSALDRCSDNGANSVSGDGVSSSRSRSSGPAAASRVWRHFRPRVVSRLVVGERTVTTGPSGTVRRTRPPGSPTSMAASPNAEFHGSARWPSDPRIAVPTASPCVTLRSRSRTGAGRCGAPLNQTSRTIDRATSSPSSGTIPPMWSLSMCVTTATSTCWSLSANPVNRSRTSGQVSGGPPRPAAAKDLRADAGTRRGCSRPSAPEAPRCGSRRRAPGLPSSPVWSHPNENRRPVAALSPYVGVRRGVVPHSARRSRNMGKTRDVFAS